MYASCPSTLKPPGLFQIIFLTYKPWSLKFSSVILWTVFTLLYQLEVVLRSTHNKLWWEASADQIYKTHKGWYPMFSKQHIYLTATKLWTICKWLSSCWWGPSLRAAHLSVHTAKQLLRFLNSLLEAGCHLVVPRVMLTPHLTINLTFFTINIQKNVMWD